MASAAMEQELRLLWATLERSQAELDVKTAEAAQLRASLADAEDRAAASAAEAASLREHHGSPRPFADDGSSCTPPSSPGRSPSLHGAPPSDVVIGALQAELAAAREAKVLAWRAAGQAVEAAERSARAIVADAAASTVLLLQRAAVSGAAALATQRRAHDLEAAALRSDLEKAKGALEIVSAKAAAAVEAAWGAMVSTAAECSAAVRGQSHGHAAAVDELGEELYRTTTENTALHDRASSVERSAAGAMVALPRIIADLHWTAATDAFQLSARAARAGGAAAATSTLQQRWFTAAVDAFAEGSQQRVAVVCDAAAATATPLGRSISTHRPFSPLSAASPQLSFRDPSPVALPEPSTAMTALLGRLRHMEQRQQQRQQTIAAQAKRIQALEAQVAGGGPPPHGAVVMERSQHGVPVARLVGTPPLAPVQPPAAPPPLATASATSRVWDACLGAFAEMAVRAKHDMGTATVEALAGSYAVARRVLATLVTTVSAAKLLQAPLSIRGSNSDRSSPGPTTPTGLKQTLSPQQRPRQGGTPRPFALSPAMAPLRVRESSSSRLLTPVGESEPAADDYFRQVDTEAHALSARWVDFVARLLQDHKEELCRSAAAAVASLREAAVATKPVALSVDAVRLQVAEGSLALVEAQRDQALLAANRVQQQVSSSVDQLRELGLQVTAVVGPDAGIADQSSGSGNALSVPPSAMASFAVSNPSALLSPARVNPSSFASVAHGGVSAQMLGTLRDAAATTQQVERASHTSMQEFNAICEQLLDRAARMHAQLIESEHVTTRLQRVAAESHLARDEFASLVDATSVTHRLEREVSDSALQILHADMAAERRCAVDGLRALAVGCAHRNVALQGQSRDTRRLLTANRSLVLIAGFMWAAHEAMCELWSDALSAGLRDGLIRSLPSASFTAFRFLVIHDAFGAALAEAAAAAAGALKDVEALAKQQLVQKAAYEEAMVAASAELVVAARTRRAESSAVALHREYTVHLIDEAVTSTYRDTHEMFLEWVAQLHGHADALPRLRVVSDRAAVLEARHAALQAAVDEATERAADREGVAARAVAALSAAQEELHEARVVTAERQVTHDRLTAEHETAAQLLHAERAARALAVSREEALARDVENLQLLLQQSREETQSALVEADQEREAHRITVQVLGRGQAEKLAAATS